MWFSKPHEKTPEFIKGRISVKVADFVKFAQAHTNSNGYIDIDLKKSKGGKLYLALNEFKKPLPTSPDSNREMPDVPVIDLPENATAEDLPF